MTRVRLPKTVAKLYEAVEELKAAYPGRHFTLDGHLVGLEGEPPDPIDIPPGCSFRTRCPFAFDRCASDDPVLMRRGPSDFAACHLAEEAAAREGRFLPRVFERAG